MILCIDTRAVECAPHVQKDISLVDLLMGHMKYFESEEEAEKERYVPLSFCVSVRTVNTNLVLQTYEDKEFRYYINLTHVDRFSHQGYDLMMYLSALALLSVVEYDYAFDELMLRSSTFMPIGLYNPDHGFMRPLLYSHIIIADEASDTFKTFLRTGNSLVSLAEMRENRKNNISALLDTLKEVKSDGTAHDDSEQQI